MHQWIAIPVAACVALVPTVLVGQAPPTPGDMLGCATSTFVVDKLVCDDAGMRKNDERVRHLLADHSDRVVSDTAFVETDESWLARRNHCAMRRDQRACLEGAYGEREAVAAAMDWPGISHSAQAVKCRADGRTAWIIENGEGMSVYDHDGRLFAFARKSQQPAWQNYVSVRLSGDEISIRNIGGGVMSCERLPASLQSP